MFHSQLRIRVMRNFYEIVMNEKGFKKIQLKEITFVEYNCPIQQEVFPIWTPHDYVVHVLSGTKTWHTSYGNKTLRKGDTAFIKKGGHIIEQDFSEIFCLLIFFIKEEFKQMIPIESVPQNLDAEKREDTDVIYPIKNNPSIIGFFHSVFSYFQMNEAPSESMLRLKYQELIHVLASEKVNCPVVCQMLEREYDTNTQLKRVVLENFRYNLALEDFAQLCNRSLSSFKRDFQRCFHMPPGKWLLETRLNQALSLLSNTDLSVTQVALDCGFENLSHFSKAFRQRMEITPKAYRESLKLTSIEQ